MNSAMFSNHPRYTTYAKKKNFFFRSFKPDFLLIRQNLRDAGEDNKNLLLGFEFGGIPSVNTLRSVYGFQVSVGTSFNKKKFGENS